MYITIVTDYDNLRLCNCTNNDNIENNIEIKITLFTIIPCGMSLICLISFMVYTLIKPLIGKKSVSNNFLFINMYWSCYICDKVIYEEFANNHLQSAYH